MSGWTLGPYRAVGHRFRVQGDRPGQVRDRLEHTLAPLAESSTEPLGTYRVSSTGTDDRVALSYEGTFVHRADSAYDLVGLIVWHINSSVVRVDRGEHLLLHAAAAERDGVTVVLPAPMESGKTTTVAGLLRAGYRYVTDETTVLDRRDLAITAFPKALALSQSAARLIGDIEVPDHVDAGAEAQQYVRWWDLDSPGVVDGGCPGLVVFPGFRHGATTALEALPPAAAVMEMAASTFRFRARPRRNLSSLVRLATAVPAYRLSIGNLDEAVHAINGLVHAHAARSMSA